MPALEARLQTLLTIERAAVWRSARTRQALGSLESAEEATGNATLDRQATIHGLREELAEIDEQLAAAERGYAEREEATAHDLDIARQRLEDHDRRFDERWKALEGDLRERCRREPLPWVWQQAREWLREETIRAIREVNPQVTPRPEGYLRISVAPGLRLGRDALFAFYRDEAKREWERFTGEARQQDRQELEEALAEAERERQEVLASREATVAPLEARYAAHADAVEAAGAEMRRELEEALTAAEALRAALEAFAL